MCRIYSSSFRIQKVQGFHVNTSVIHIMFYYCYICLNGMEKLLLHMVGMMWRSVHCICSSYNGCTISQKDQSLLSAVVKFSQYFIVVTQSTNDFEEFPLLYIQLTQWVIHICEDQILMSAAIQFTRYFIVITKCMNDMDECQLHIYFTKIHWGAWNWIFHKCFCILFH